MHRHGEHLRRVPEKGQLELYKGEKIRSKMPEIFILFCTAKLYTVNIFELIGPRMYIDEIFINKNPHYTLIILDVILLLQCRRNVLVRKKITPITSTKSPLFKIKFRLVAWMHFEQSAILTVNSHVITRNPRITVSHDKHRTWFLHINNVQQEDRGRYMCQINTITAKTQIGFLNVVETSWSYCNWIIIDFG
ncbi:hypothetical protein AGLY_000611 [Aphis glycines]|uniref:Immunoglobulin domain-containing protein n=1 Tax=Aphis glycines TaxID=307491 RepID=A0A6G0U7H1_APHGL|nr:hypothetical protein AGLY_000611 [Aphis glycines]